MFVRAKTVKGKKYAYLVHNKWVGGKVKQQTKKYLGKIIVLPDEEKKFSSIVLEEHASPKDCIHSLILHEFKSRSFSFDKVKNVLQKDDIVIDLKRGAIHQNGKNVVLFLNGSYVYGSVLYDLLDFFQPESKEDVKGKRLAVAFRNSGIFISSENFISLYKKLYSSFS